jgi:hypothetical protein
MKIIMLTMDKNALLKLFNLKYLFSKKKFSVVVFLMF